MIVLSPSDSPDHQGSILYHSESSVFQFQQTDSSGKYEHKGGFHYNGA